ncbi:autotransporter outer membrane beta-barrel domain-containing protein [Herbaspirillum sp. YR522]|uniref:autotransporter family protein n=1 Tax=Herbaspirillum sp. YR522 TaxID=1144342 RepID=UPI00026F4B22|nr:autotransporter outer membrane beta-barrel domain-containing protein [Herbaspirillum sp. YR522]EJM97463.1 outer membrane autotransporter barrel domain-containing protein [Herbaspirillum sp. YR522]
MSGSRSHAARRPACFSRPRSTVRNSIVIGASALALTATLEASAAPCGTNVAVVNTSCTQGLTWSNAGGTLTNNATIDGVGGNFNGFTAGVGVTGSGSPLSLLVNNGTITDTYVAVWTQSRGIDTLVNNGLIMSPSAWAIAENIRIGTIVNNGTIYGSISAYNTGNMTIVGAANGFGTITGGGNNAVVYNNAGDIEFAGGSTLLDSNMTVSASNKVFNNGATLKFVRNRSVSGNYLQTGGSLIFAATSASAFPRLSISGTATLNGGTIVLVPVSGQNATSYTIITAAGGVTSTAVASAAGYSVTSAVSGNNLVVTLSQIVAPTDPSSPSIPAAPVASNWTSRANGVGGSAVPIGPVLDRLSGNADYALILTGLSMLQAAPQGRALQQLSGPTPLPQALSGGASYALSSGAISQRQVTLLAGRPTAKAAGSSTDGTGLWGQLLGNKASMNGTGQAGGFHSSGYGLILGADRQLGPQVVLGGALAWLHNDLKGEGSNTGSDVKLDSYQLAAYGSWRPRGGQGYLSGIASVARNNYDQARAVDFLGTASASYRGWQAQAKLETGYDLPMSAGLTVTPLLSLQAARISNDGYSESGLGAASLNVQRQGFSNLDSELGVRLSSYTDTGWGRLTGDWQTGWVHSFSNDAIATTSSMGGVSFVSTAERLPKDGAHIVLRGTLQRSNNLSYAVGYEGDLRSRFRSQTASVKMRYDF